MEKCALDFMDYVHIAQLRLGEMHKKGLITTMEYEASYTSLDNALEDIGINLDEQDF